MTDQTVETSAASATTTDADPGEGMGLATPGAHEASPTGEAGDLRVPGDERGAVGEAREHRPPGDVLPERHAVLLLVAGEAHAVGTPEHRRVAEAVLLALDHAGDHGRVEAPGESGEVRLLGRAVDRAVHGRRALWKQHEVGRACHLAGGREVTLGDVLRVGEDSGDTPRPPALDHHRVEHPRVRGVERRTDGHR